MHFVLVDFQNVTKVDLDRLSVDNVVLLLFLGENQKKLSASLERQVIHHPAEVRLIKVGESTPNALDKKLSGYLGGLCSRHREADFYIVSKDKDFDLVVSCLRGTGLRVDRYDAFEEMPIVAPKKGGSSRPPFPMVMPVEAPVQLPVTPTPKGAADKMAKFILHLRRSQASNRTKLEHSIAAYFKPSLPAGGMKGVIAELKKRGVVAIDDKDHVTYPAPT
ncbi:hypothetical protein Verru16b_02546 [Lacunisphaera limnophila]|uniref:PIN-like domain-containing protein n=1 Tax=Lacunisphaera limnophila TaxID=1838286 RepID=A0A1D8AX42_9BACT|nr:PIN domain-containing protein [Lacunisphaera limnophila]AOS45465.1 hypothetical protein Verru16b_02546 [Lacunisphaera limnophila]